MMEVEHLYFSLASAVVLIGWVATQGAELVQFISERVVSWSISGPLAIAAASLAMPAGFLWMAARARRRARDFLADCARTMPPLRRVFETDVELGQLGPQAAGEDPLDWRNWAAALVFALFSGLGFGLFGGLPLDGPLGSFLLALLPPDDRIAHLAGGILKMSFLGSYLAIAWRGLSALRYRSFDPDAEFQRGTADLMMGFALGLTVALLAAAVPRFGDVGPAGNLLLVAMLAAGLLLPSSLSPLLERRFGRAARLDEVDLPPPTSSLPPWANGTPLRQLDGVTREVEARLGHLGIGSVQALASANPMLLFVRVPYGLHQILDWIGQALLATLVPPEARDMLRRSGTRTIADLLRSADQGAHDQTIPPVLARTVEHNAMVRRYLRVLAAAPAATDGLSATRVPALPSADAEKP